MDDYTLLKKYDYTHTLDSSMMYMAQEQLDDFAHRAATTSVTTNTKNLDGTG